MLTLHFVNYSLSNLAALLARANLLVMITAQKECSIIKLYRSLDPIMTRGIVLYCILQCFRCASARNWVNACGAHTQPAHLHDLYMPAPTKGKEHYAMCIQIHGY
jgi:hypothetical protein